jgi:hypothetical protein
LTDRHAIPPLDERGLRRFGIVTGAMFAGLFGLLFPWLLDRSVPIWPWVIFAVLVLVGLFAPRLLRPLYYGWMRVALWMSRLTTPVILGVAFFLVITPFGLVMRALGKDPTRRKWDPAADSYRVESKRTDKDSLEKPY